MDSRTTSAAAVILLVLMALLAGGGMLKESATYDEVAHIGAGLSYWQRLDLRLNPEHPPLAKAIAALPLVLMGARADYNHAGWRMSEGFFAAYVGQLLFGESVLKHWNRPDRILMLARLPMLGLTIACGWFIFRIARRIGGSSGGVLCLAVYASTPLFLSMGPLVTSDVAVTLFTLTTLSAFAELLKDPRPKYAAYFSLSFAAALLTKYSALVLWFTLPLVLLSFRWKRAPAAPAADPHTHRVTRGLALWGGFLGAAAVTYAAMLALSWNQPLSAVSRLDEWSWDIGGMRRALMPVWLYFRGAFFVLLTGTRPAFLLGHSYASGVWYYFPVLLALKSPLGFLGLLVLSAAASVLVKVRRMRNAGIPSGSAALWRIVWIAFLIHALVGIFSPLNIGFRHFSVALALLILLLAPLPRLLTRIATAFTAWRRVGQTVAAALVMLCLASTVFAFPDYLPYANGLSFGRPGYWLFNDSNVDWGQALPDVQRFVQSRGLHRIAVDPYSFTDPRADVPLAELWDCQQPSAADAGQWVAVSANMMMSGADCLWLLKHEHVALGGGAMYAVRLPEPIPRPGAQGGPPLRPGGRMFRASTDAVDDRQTFADLMQRPETALEAGERITAQFNASVLGFFEKTPALRRLAAAVLPAVHP